MELNKQRKHPWILPIILSIFLIVSICINGYIYSQITSLNKSISDTLIQLDTLQSDVNTVNKEISDYNDLLLLKQKENEQIKQDISIAEQKLAEINETSNDQTESYELTKPNQSIDVNPIYDANTVLSSGITMGDAANAVDAMKKELKNAKTPMDEQIKTLQDFCEQLGTTLEAIESFQLTQEPQTPTPNPTPSNNGGSTGGQIGGGDTGDNGPSDFDPGIFGDDDGSGGTSTSQPNPFNSN